jgi:hypothetical protein
VRRLHRELESLKKERIRHRNRIRDLLVAQGLRLGDFLQCLEMLTPWDGTPRRSRLTRARRVGAEHDGRLSFGLLDAARPESRAAAAGPARERRLRRQVDRGRAPLLRLGRYLQRAAARDRGATADREIANVRERAPMSSPPVMSAASVNWDWPRARRWCTPSSCSIGDRRAAGRESCELRRARGVSKSSVNPARQHE